MALSGSGIALASSKPHNTLCLWEIESGVELLRLEGHSWSMSGVAPGPDGRTVFTASLEGDVLKWNLPAQPKRADSGDETGRVLYECKPQGVHCIALCPDGQNVLVGLSKGQSDSPDYSLRLVDAETGREIRRLVGHQAPVLALAIHPDGQWALSGAIDGTALLWNLNSGSVIHRLVGHTGAVLDVAFSSHDPLAATCSQDESVILWDVNTGEELRRYLGHRGEVKAVCMARDGRTVFSAGADLTVREWRIDATQDELLDWIRDNRYVDRLSPEQRARYDIDWLDDALAAP
jgi:hypothetical protein